MEDSQFGLLGQPAQLPAVQDLMEDQELVTIQRLPMVALIVQGLSPSRKIAILHLAVSLLYQIRMIQHCFPTFIALNGAFSLWTAWGSCSLTCGTGTQTRARSCNNPAPAHGGSNCTGSYSESQNCNTSPCRKLSSSYKDDLALLSYLYSC